MSIDEVAKAAGVSTATVSRALSGRGPVSAVAHGKVLAAADRLGYVVSASASSLASGRARSIGVLLPAVDRWFFSTVLRGISFQLQRVGYDVTLYHLSDDRAERDRVFGTALRRRRVDAVLTVSVELTDDELARLRDLGLPVLGIGSADPRVHRLTVDETAVARTATEHLLELGHRRIAYIGYLGPAHAAHDIPAIRHEAYEHAMAVAGIPADQRLTAPGDFSIESGYTAADALLRRTDPPTAIFAGSDEMAVGALLAARARGCRVPGDLSIVGVDGHELSGFMGLTTVDQFPLRQGERAAAAIVALLEEADADAAPSAEALPFELVVRGSSAAPA